MLHSYTPQQKMKPVTLELSDQIIHHPLFLDSFVFWRLKEKKKEQKRRGGMGEGGGRQQLAKLGTDSFVFS